MSTWLETAGGPRTSLCFKNNFPRNRPFHSSSSRGFKEWIKTSPIIDRGRSPFATQTASKVNFLGLVLCYCLRLSSTPVLLPSSCAFPPIPPLMYFFFPITNETFALLKIKTNVKIIQHAGSCYSRFSPAAPFSRLSSTTELILPLSLPLSLPPTWFQHLAIHGDWTI